MVMTGSKRRHSRCKASDLYNQGYIGDYTSRGSSAVKRRVSGEYLFTCIQGVSPRHTLFVYTVGYTESRWPNKTLR